MFLDRDGVINENRPDHVKSWDEFLFLPGVFDALGLLANDNCPIVVISNQAAINRGLVRRESVEEIHWQMCNEIARQGGRIDAVYYCPHRPDEGCDCRKPRPGLLMRAANEMNLDLRYSHFVGDALSDVEAAITAGCQPVLVLTGRGRDQLSALQQQVHDCVPVVPNLAEAIGLVLRSRSLDIKASNDR